MPTTLRTSGWCGAITLQILPRRRGDAVGGRRHHVSTLRHGAWCTPIDARTGKRLWTYDPKIDRERRAIKGCCDVVNRGVALWKGKVFVGAYDGRLIALDADTGKVVWEKDTIDRAKGTPTPSPARRACSTARW